MGGDHATYHLDKPECRKAHAAADKKACDAATGQRRRCAKCGKDLSGHSTGMVPIIQDGKHTGDHATYHLDKPECRKAHAAADKKACDAATGQRRRCAKCGKYLSGHSTGMVPIIQDGKH